jgi:hypothetical protein
MTDTPESESDQLARFEREREHLAHAIHKRVQSSVTRRTVPFLVGDADRAVTAVIAEGWTPPPGYGE